MSYCCNDLSTRVAGTGVAAVLYNLTNVTVQHVRLGQSDNEAVSGQWVREVVKTGEDSWRPLHLLLLCSVTCVTSALQQVGCSLDPLLHAKCMKIYNIFSSSIGSSGRESSMSIALVCRLLCGLGNGAPRVLW